MSQSILYKLAKAILPKRIYGGIRAGLTARYDSDGLVTSHLPVFLDDPKFRESYRLGSSLGSWNRDPIEWRAYICCWAATKAATIEGDFVECGVWRGGLSRTVINYVDFGKLDKRFYLLDTFEGLAVEHLAATESVELAKSMNKQHYNPEVEENQFESVQRTFAPFANVELIKGRVPETLAQVKSEKVAYLSIDMNNVTPEIAAAEFFWPKLTSGGVIVLDDYAYSPQFEAQRIAFDKFAAERGVMVLNVPTGQGLIFKT